MKNRVELYVEKLPDAVKKEIIANYEQFQADGFIGDVPLREHAKALLREMGIDVDSHITVWMTQVAFECYREQAARTERIETLAALYQREVENAHHDISKWAISESLKEALRYLERP